MSTFTPGPWFVRSEDDGREPRVFITRAFGDGPPRFYIAFIPDAGQGVKESYANARLIAAAPELLKELQTAVAWIEDDSEYRPTADEILPQLRAAIAEATAAD